MKVANTVKQDDLFPQFDEVLRKVLVRVPSLKIDSVEREVKLGGTQLFADGIFKVSIGGQEWTFIVEVKSKAFPEIVRTAILQVGHYLALIPQKTRKYAIIVAPFISEESARLCSEAGMGCVDLCGNARLAFGSVYIETRSADNPFREKREQRSIFSPRAARVLRVLLQGPLRSWKVTELAAVAQVSLGHVSSVRRQLLAQEWAADRPEGLLVTKPKAVLDAWSRSDVWEKRTETREYSTPLSGDLPGLARQIQKDLGDVAFTQWFAGWVRQPYTQPPVVTAYVRKFPEESVISEKWLARRVSDGGRLRLVVPGDEGVFFATQTVQGFNVVCDVQIYLDLLHAGQRGDEAAAELRNDKNFSGGWA